MNIERVIDRPRLRNRAVAELMSAYMTELLGYLTAEELELALLRNALRAPGESQACHLHDYCDDNQLLINAWDTVFDADNIHNGSVCVGEGNTLDLQNDAHSSLLEEARDKVHAALMGVLV